MEFRAVWDRTLEQAPWVYSADTDMLIQYVVAAVDAARLGRALVKGPMVERDPNTGGPKSSTVRREWNRSVAAMLSLAREFGLTPAARRDLRETVAASATTKQQQAAVDELFF